MRIVWVVFAAYLVLTLLIGELAARLKIRSMDDYLLSGRKEGPLVTAGTLAATVIGGGSSLGAAGVGYYAGVSAAWYLLSASIGLLLLGWTLAPALRRLRVYTVPEYIGERYGARAKLLAASLGVLGLTLFLAAQLFAMGSVIGHLMGTSRETAILISGVVVVIYTWRGGITAIHWTDNFQLVWIVVGLVLVGAMGVQALGGWQGFATPPPAAGFEELGRAWFNPMTGEKVGGGDLFALGSVVVGWVIMSTTWHFAMQSTAQRVLSARDPGAARRGCFLAAVLLVPLAGCVVASGMAARILHPGLEAPAGIEQVQALPALIEGLLSPGLAGIVLAALVAVIMSTSDSALLGASTILVRDLGPGLLRGREERASIRLLGGTTIVLGVLAIGAALVAPTLVQMLELVAAVYCVSLFVPLIAGLYWRRASEAGALAAMVLSGATGILWRALGYESATRYHMLVLALPAAVIGMVVVSLVVPGAGGTSAGEPSR